MTTNDQPAECDRRHSESPPQIDCDIRNGVCGVHGGRPKQQPANNDALEALRALSKRIHDAAYAPAIDPLGERIGYLDSKEWLDEVIEALTSQPNTDALEAVESAINQEIVNATNTDDSPRYIEGLQFAKDAVMKHLHDFEPASTESEN